MSLKRIHYNKPNNDPGMYSVYDLDKTAPPNDYAIPAGVVVRYTSKKATVCTWESIAALIGEAMVVSPVFREDIKRAVAVAEAIESAPAEHVKEGA